VPSGETWITFRTDDATNAGLDRLAAARGITRSELLRRLVAKELFEAERWGPLRPPQRSGAGSAVGTGGR
jgi:hypothetical protein